MLLLAGFADMRVSCRFPILWSLFPPSASGSPCGSAEAWTATTIIQHSCFVRPCIRNSSASALPARPSCVFCPWCFVQFFVNGQKKLKITKFSRTFSKELFRGHIFASGGENCANFSFASPFPAYAQTFTKWLNHTSMPHFGRPCHRKQFKKKCWRKNPHRTQFHATNHCFI